MAESGENKVIMPAKWTDGGGGKNLPRVGRNRQFMGWDGEGLIHFHKLGKEIDVERRTSEERRAFEDAYRQQKREEHENKKKRKRERRHYAADDNLPKETFNEMGRDVFFGTESDSQFLQGLERGEDAVQDGDINLPGISVEDAANEVITQMGLGSDAHGNGNMEIQETVLGGEELPMYEA